VLFEADVPSAYPEGHPLRLTTRPYTPVFVFLDPSGKKVAETGGFRNVREAKALHEFVSKRLYTKMDWDKFLAAYPGK
jgi:thioredoxin-related protein